ncbi:hypothetical protein [Streptomyces iranensis]|uniref:Uncharacterized protein n=1 Tax=Streptomyces iranensis TaxID=576784 RepID=A0A060ZYH8_9ACTN|nr:hypothetical protein [Streptomyces iranensis]MBP2066724.1 hypothetical protein [Streptomyces iranensis]CDR08543.1 predicted protein [Streptomyces iranensis]
MGARIDRLIGTREARAAHRAARQELAEVSDRDRRAGLHDETDEFVAANSKVNAAEKQLPRWRRLPDAR